MTLHHQLQQRGHDYLLRFWDELSPYQQQQLEDQIADIDFDQLQSLLDAQHTQRDWQSDAMRAQSPRAVRLDGNSPTHTHQQAIDCGETALAAGKIGMILVAGGQGSRLGFDQPKGMFPIGPISQRTLFQFHADLLKATGDRYGVVIPLYIMTSPATHEPTLEYLQATDNLGLAKGQLRVFCQGTMPAIDRNTGRLLMQSKDSLALSPDGHGGTVDAFAQSGLLDEAIAAGIEHLTYAQIDNPLANPCQSALLGHHLLSHSEMTTQVVRKRYPTERVGNVVMIDDQLHIIEYIHLPEQAAKQTLDDGSLKLWAGNIAIHVFTASFLKQAQQHADRMPLNQAFKKVPYIDDGGKMIEPSEANAIKFERFIFDLLPFAKNAIVVEGDPAEVFAPVKNGDDADNDTPTTAKAAICALHREWLTQAGASVAPQVRVEIHPSWAMDAQAVSQRVGDGMQIDADLYLR